MLNSYNFVQAKISSVNFTCLIIDSANKHAMTIERSTLAYSSLIYQKIKQSARINLCVGFTNNEKKNEGKRLQTWIGLSMLLNFRWRVR